MKEVIMCIADGFVHCNGKVRDGLGAWVEDAQSSLFDCNLTDVECMRS